MLFRSGVYYPAAVAYGNGTWVVADNRYDAQDYVGFLVSKDDGVTWEIVKNALAWGVPTGMAYADGKFVLVGDRGMIATSTNGRTWKTATLSPDATTKDGLLRGPVYAQGRWIAVTSVGSAFFSTNASYWEFLPSWLVGGDDGSPYNFNGLTYGNGFFAAAGLQGSLWTSQQGKAWGKRTWTDAGTNFTDVAFGNGRFVAIGSTFAVSK